MFSAGIMGVTESSGSDGCISISARMTSGVTSRTVSSEDTTRIAAFMSLNSLLLTWERRFSDGDDSLRAS